MGQYEGLRSGVAVVGSPDLFRGESQRQSGVVRALANAGAGFDVVSGGELYRVVRAGGIRAVCVCGRGENAGGDRVRVEAGDLFISMWRARRSCGGFRGSGARDGAAGADSDSGESGRGPGHASLYFNGETQSKFGISIRRALEVYREAAGLAGIEIRGVQMHIGSQITKTGPFVLAIRKIRPLVEQVREMAPGYAAIV